MKPHVADRDQGQHLVRVASLVLVRTTITGERDMAVRVDEAGYGGSACVHFHRCGELGDLVHEIGRWTDLGDSAALDLEHPVGDGRQTVRLEQLTELQVALPHHQWRSVWPEISRGLMNPP